MTSFFYKLAGMFVNRLDPELSTDYYFNGLLLLIHEGISNHHVFTLYLGISAEQGTRGEEKLDIYASPVVNSWLCYQLLKTKPVC